MKTLQILHSIAAGDAHVEETDTYRVHHIPYVGFSRGLGEFMHLTRPLVTGEFPWIMIQPHDNELNYDEAVKACSESPYHYFGIALSDDSYASFSHVFRNNQYEGWREIPFYDHGMFFSYEFYKVISPHFHESKSHWGMDLLTAHFHRNLYGSTCGLYCGATMRHTDPIRSNTFVIDGVTPDKEMAAIRRKYNI